MSSQIHSLNETVLHKKTQDRFEKIQKQVSRLWDEHKEVEKALKISVALTNATLVLSILMILFSPNLTNVGWVIFSAAIVTRIIYLFMWMKHWKTFYYYCEKFGSFE